MVGHLEVPELGKNPASISSHIIYNLLCRNWLSRFGFYRCFGDERYFAK